MKISKREQILVVSAAVVVALVATLVIVPRLRNSAGTTAPDDRTLDGMRVLAEQKVAQYRRLDLLAEDLAVRLPTAEPGEQIEEIVKSIEKLVGASNLELSAFNPRSTTSRSASRRAAGSEVDFELRFAADHRGLFGFINGMGAEGLPVRIESLQLRTQSNPQKMDVVMNLTFVLLEPMPAPREEKEAKDAKQEKQPS
jgi:hypothetical protein